jgi:hypothetical protein
MLISELCSLYGISRQWFNKRVDRGEIPGVRRKANGRLEIFDEGMATADLNYGPKARCDQKFDARQRRLKRAMSVVLAKSGLQLPPAAGKTTRHRMRVVKKSVDAEARRLQTDTLFAREFVKRDSTELRMVMQREWIKRARGIGSKSARAMVIRWRENPGTHIVDDLRAMASYKILGKTSGVTKGKKWTLPTGNRHGSMAMIARTFGISRQALSQALRRYLRK